MIQGGVEVFPIVVLGDVFRRVPKALPADETLKQAINKAVTYGRKQISVTLGRHLPTKAVRFYVP